MKKCGVETAKFTEDFLNQMSFSLIQVRKSSMSFCFQHYTLIKCIITVPNFFSQFPLKNSEMTATF
jgi:hypothetical protein